MLEEYQDLIEELLGTPSLVREAFNRSDSRPPDRVLLQIVAVHERDSVVLSRLQRLVRETAPHFTTLPDYDTAVQAAEIPADLNEFLGAFETTRGDLVSLLMNLTLRDWERTATHDRGDSIELVDEVEEHVEFDEKLRAALAA